MNKYEVIEKLDNNTHLIVEPDTIKDYCEALQISYPTHLEFTLKSDGTTGTPTYEHNVGLIGIAISAFAEYVAFEICEFRSKLWSHGFVTHDCTKAILAYWDKQDKIIHSLEF